MTARHALHFLAVTMICLWAAAPSRAASIKVSTWNLDWLTLRSAADADLPADITPRTEADLARLKTYAVKLAADIVAFQEVDGAAAAARLFDPHDYTIVTVDEPVTQRVGMAVRTAIGIVKNPDVTALDVEPDAKYRLRDGLDVTLTLPGGTRLRALVVHLKTGCQTDQLLRSRRPQCALLARQIAPLAAWISARQAEKQPFMVLGDFNRVLDDDEKLGEALAKAAPLLRVTQGFQDPCWNGGPFIDHIFLGGAARDWLIPDSLRVQIFHEIGDDWKSRLSDHCPVSVTLNVPNGAR